MSNFCNGLLCRIKMGGTKNALHITSNKQTYIHIFLTVSTRVHQFGPVSLSADVYREQARDLYSAQCTHGAWATTYKAHTAAQGRVHGTLESVRRPLTAGGIHFQQRERAELLFFPLTPLFGTTAI